MPPTSDIGLIGLAVMGQNLALNIADHGNQIAVYNRTQSVTDEFAAQHSARVACPERALGGCTSNQH